MSSTYINDDSELLSAKANERCLTPAQQLDRAVAQVRRPADVAGDRARDHAAQADDRDAAAEGSGQARRTDPDRHAAWKACTAPASTAPAKAMPKTCRQLGELEDVLRSNRDYDAQLDAWQGWHTIAQPMRKDYARFVELVNEGAKRPGLRRRRRNVALRLRHDAGRDRRRDRSPLGPGQAAVRAAALLRAHQAARRSTAPTRAQSPAACCPRT